MNERLANAKAAAEKRSAMKGIHVSQEVPRQSARAWLLVVGRDPSCGHRQRLPIGSPHAQDVRDACLRRARGVRRR